MFSKKLLLKFVILILMTMLLCGCSSSSNINDTNIQNDNEVNNGILVNQSDDIVIKNDCFINTNAGIIRDSNEDQLIDTTKPNMITENIKNDENKKAETAVVKSEQVDDVHNEIEYAKLDKQELVSSNEQASKPTVSITVNTQIPSTSTQSSDVDKKENNIVVETNNIPYDGDVAVPPDVNNSSNKCNEHDLELINTKIDASYELFNYVTDYYKCKKCNYTSTNVHIASANVSEQSIDNAEQDIIKLVNKLRVDNGLNELWVDDAWDVWANTRAHELESFYGHRRPDGSDWLYAIDDNYTIGENIASGQSSGVGFYNAFYNSVQHKDLMLAEDAIGIAVSVYVNDGGATYCAMIIVGMY